jgi:hypothetical protein
MVDQRMDGQDAILQPDAIQDLRAQFANMENKMDSLLTKVNENLLRSTTSNQFPTLTIPHQLPTQRHFDTTSTPLSLTNTSIPSLINNLQQQPPLKPTWADCVQQIPQSQSTAYQGYGSKLKEGSTRMNLKQVTGKKSIDNTKVRAVPRKISVFVGRLEKDTLEEDMKQMLKDGGILDCYCKKLSGKDRTGREYKSAAFIISCDEKYEDIIYNDETWPANAQVREWFNLTKQPIQQING